MSLCFLPLPTPGSIIINEISQFMKILSHRADWRRELAANTFFVTPPLYLK